MPTSLPETETMLLYIEGRIGKKVAEIKKEVEEYKKNFASVVSSSDRLMTYLYMKNVLGIEMPIIPSQTEEMQNIADVLKSAAQSKINTSGYLLRMWDFKTKKDSSPCKGMAIGDRTGMTEVMAFFKERVKQVEESGIKEGDFVLCQNMSVSEYKGKKNLTFGSGSQIAKAKEISFKLEEVATKVSSLKNGASALIQVTVLNSDEHPYFGCPDCLKKIPDVKEGQKAKCPSEKCGHEVIATKLAFVRYLATDGDNDLTLSVAPSRNGNSVKKMSTGKIYNVYGRYKEKEKRGSEFSVDWAKPVAGFEEETGTTTSKSTVKASGDMIKSKIPVLLKSWKGMTEKKLIETCTKLMECSEEQITAALKALMKEGKIYYENDMYHVAKPLVDKKEE